jgi:glutaredoxin
MSSVPPRRCEQHALAAGPDGQCVICRRERGVVVSAQVPDREAAGASQLPKLLLAVFAIVGGAALLIGFGMRPSAPPPMAAARATIAQQPIADDADALAKQKADDLAESLRKLERAEVERREQERVREEREQAERAAAEAERKREEQERDLKRHEAVKRELDELALGAARRNVSITMYSTSWCGVCIKARDYMVSKQISFKEHDVDHDAAAKSRARLLNPRGSVPTIAIDSEILIGFSPESLEARITRAAKRRTGS